MSINRSHLPRRRTSNFPIPNSLINFSIFPAKSNYTILVSFTSSNKRTRSLTGFLSIFLVYLLVILPVFGADALSGLSSRQEHLNETERHEVDKNFNVSSIRPKDPLVNSLKQRGRVVKETEKSLKQTEETEINSTKVRSPLPKASSSDEQSSLINKNKVENQTEETRSAKEVTQLKNSTIKNEDKNLNVIPALTVDEFKQKQVEQRKSHHQSLNNSTSDIKVKEKPASAVVSDSRSSAEKLLNEAFPDLDCEFNNNSVSITANDSATDQQQAKARKNCSALVVTKNSSDDQMILLEKTAIDLLPLETMLGAILTALAATFMVIGGALPYVPQYFEIQKRKSALGFSLLVCLVLCVANILRVMFWFGKRFETVLLVQSAVMITCMLLMLEISVRMNKKMTPPSQRTSIWKGDLLTAFWKWNDLSSFLIFLIGFTAVAGVITLFLTQFPLYVEALGMVSLLVEACLASPQLIRNFTRKSTEGMSIGMVILWLCGDVGKTVYFVVRKVPAQFWICSLIQITIDLLILGQVWFYNRSSARIPTYIPSQPAKKTSA